VLVTALGIAAMRFWRVSVTKRVLPSAPKPKPVGPITNAAGSVRSPNELAMVVNDVAAGVAPVRDSSMRNMLPCETTAPLAATVPFRTLATNSTAVVPISSAVISHGPLMPLPEIVATGAPLLSKIIRQPACAVAEVPSVVGKLPTITKPEFKATSAVVSPTPPGQAPGKDPEIWAKTVMLPLGEIWTIVVPVPCRLAELLKLLTSTLFAINAPMVTGTTATP
jgi:hypothetical protein